MCERKHFTIRPSDLRLQMGHRRRLPVLDSLEAPDCSYAILNTPTTDDPVLDARFGNATSYDVLL